MSWRWVSRRKGRDSKAWYASETPSNLALGVQLENPSAPGFRSGTKMKYSPLSHTLLAGTLAFGLAGGNSLAQQPATTGSQPTNGHPFACADYSQGKIFLVGADGKVQWDYQTSSCNDLWVLPNGNLLFNTGH